MKTAVVTNHIGVNTNQAEATDSIKSLRLMSDIFNSEQQDTSIDTDAIVANAILQKYTQVSNDQ